MNRDKMREGEWMINAAARSISFNDQAGAFLMTGTEKVRSGYGNGDCILMDFDHSVFALSDSSERYSSASRNLLERLYKRLNEDGVPENADKWKSAINSLFSFQDYRQKATFSCAAFDVRADRIEMTVLNGGDSAIFLLNTRKNSFEYMSRPDMYFAGRSTEISHVSRLVLEGSDYRVMLCTDGLSDIAKTAGRSPAEFLMDSLSDNVSAIPQVIRRLADSNDSIDGAEYDDTGVLVLDPAACLKRKQGCILMGGTTPVEESEYQRKYKMSGELDNWMGFDEIAGKENMLRACGISFLS